MCIASMLLCSWTEKDGGNRDRPNVTMQMLFNETYVEYPVGLQTPLAGIVKTTMRRFLISHCTVSTTKLLNELVLILEFISCSRRQWNCHDLSNIRECKWWIFHFQCDRANQLRGERIYCLHFDFTRSSTASNDRTTLVRKVTSTAWGTHILLSFRFYSIKKYLSNIVTPKMPTWNRNALCL